MTPYRTNALALFTPAPRTTWWRLLCAYFRGTFKKLDARRRCKGQMQYYRRFRQFLSESNESMGRLHD